jgi:hypothetical protein
MRVRFGSARTAQRVAVAAVAAGLVIGLAACGAAVAGSASHGTGHHAPVTAHSSPRAHTAAAGTLCSQANSVDTVTVTRTVGPRTGHIHEALPRGFTIRDTTAVRSLARALCALPAVLAGVMSCPIDFGGSYRLMFARGGHPFAAVSVETGGCRTVSGLGGRARWWAKTPKFWPAMSRALSTRHTMIPL